MWFVIQVSDHPGAGARIPTDAAARTWRTVYAGDTTATEVRNAVDNLAGKWARHARAFKGADVGRLFYASFDMRKDK